MKLQIIAKELKDISRINVSDADSILFLTSIKSGGRTPYEFDIKDAKDLTKKKISVLLKRWDENVEPTEEMLIELEEDILMLNKMGIQSVVFSSVMNGKLDKKTIKDVIKKLKAKELIFGFEFSSIKDKVKAAQELKTLGYSRIIASAELDKDLILDLKKTGLKVSLTNVYPETIEYVRELKVDEIILGLEVRETPTEQELEPGETKTITITPPDKRKKPYVKVIEPIPFDPFDKRIDLEKTKEFKIISSEK